MILPAIAVLAVLAMLTACTADIDEGAESYGAKAVTFTLQDNVTRSGYAGDMDDRFIRATGFGVFAYTGEADDAWDDAKSILSPDFMRNQHVTYDGTIGWTYAPLKYWSNDEDFTLTFFAYAPYVTAGDDGSGIVSLPTAETTGDPLIGYRTAVLASRSVDLTYGVSGDDGLPIMDMTKQGYNETVSFRFRHALTRVAATVRAEAKSTEPDWDAVRVVIESIELGTTGQRLYTEGKLNLRGNADGSPLWQDVANPVTDLTAQLDASMIYNNAGTTYMDQPIGVTKTKQSLFGKALDGTSDAQLLYIPGAVSDEPITVTVKYHVVGAASNEEYTATTSLATDTYSFVAGQVTTLNLVLPIPRCQGTGE